MTIDPSSCCSVCLCHIDNDERLLPCCLHGFHEICLRNAIMHTTARTCPLCRTVVPTYVLREFGLTRPVDGAEKVRWLYARDVALSKGRPEFADLVVEYDTRALPGNIVLREPDDFIVYNQKQLVPPPGYNVWQFQGILMFGRL